MGSKSNLGGSPVQTSIEKSPALKVTLPPEWYASDPNSTRPSRASADTSPWAARYWSRGETSSSKLVWSDGDTHVKTLVPREFWPEYSVLQVGIEYVGG